jgi:hypothetical protein
MVTMTSKQFARPLAILPGPAALGWLALAQLDP